MKTRNRQSAQIQFHGEPGITQPCVEAVLRLVHFGDTITKAALLTCNNEHCFLLTINEGDRVAIKSGFTSGYHGEGPRGLATALRLLQRHGADIDEFVVAESIFRAIDECTLTLRQLDQLDSSSPQRPLRWFDYIYSVEGDHEVNNRDKPLNDLFPVTVPYALIDAKIIDLALTFAANPDGCLLSAYRRLEDTVRQKACLPGESSTRLFAKAFQSETPPLAWTDGDTSEQKARASLFDAVYRAYRNPRAHRESPDEMARSMREFLLVNELFHLEASSFKQASTADLQPASTHSP